MKDDLKDKAARAARQSGARDFRLLPSAFCLPGGTRRIDPVARK